MSEERLMKTPEEVRQKARELLQMPKEEVLTKYMFQEQEIERLHSIIKEAREYCDKEIGNIIAYFDYVDTKDLENIKKILDKVEENKCIK